MENAWLVLSYHSMVSDPQEYNTTPEALEAHLQMAINSGIAIVTVDQAINELAPQL